MSEKEERYHVSYSYMVGIFTHYGTGEVFATDMQDAWIKACIKYDGHNHIVQKVS